VTTDTVVLDLKTSSPLKLANMTPTMALAVGRRWMAAVVAAAPFLVVLEDHAMVVALPPLQRDLGLSLAGLEWVVNIYTLTFAVLTLGGGMLADRFGARPVFLAGLALFTAASLVAGLAPNGSLLIGMRATQGAGAALIGPAALAILVNSFAGPARGLALGAWSGAVAAATASGPLLGGLLTENAGWRSIFLVNVPVGIALLITAVITLPASRAPSRGTRIDIAGVVTSAIALSAGVFGISQASTYGWTSPRVWGTLGIAATAFAIFVVVERRAPTPLLDRSLFRLPNFLAANLLSMLNVAVMCSMLFFLSLYLQLGVGISAIQVGFALLPFTVLLPVLAPLAGWLAARIGARLLSGTGLALLATGLLLLGRVDAGWGPAQLLPGLLAAGIGLGLATTPITMAAMEHVSAERSGVAAATLNASGMVGMSLGIVVMGAIVSGRVPADLAGSPAGPDGFATGVGRGLAVNAALALVAAAIAVAMFRSRRVAVALPAGSATTKADAAGDPNRSAERYAGEISVRNDARSLTTAHARISRADSPSFEGPFGRHGIPGKSVAWYLSPANLSGSRQGAEGGSYEPVERAN
jgi:EmrB/QacA subfamily drug resistance transporter